MDARLSLIERSLSRSLKYEIRLAKMHEVQEETHFSLLGCGWTEFLAGSVSRQDGKTH